MGKHFCQNLNLYSCPQISKCCFYHNSVCAHFYPELQKIQNDYSMDGDKLLQKIQNDYSMDGDKLLQRCTFYCNRKNLH